MQSCHSPQPKTAAEREPGQAPRCGVSELAPPDLTDPVIELYKRDVDRTLLLKNLELSPAQRAEKLVDFVRFLDEIRRAGQSLKAHKP